MRLRRRLILEELDLLVDDLDRSTAIADDQPEAARQPAAVVDTAVLVAAGASEMQPAEGSDLVDRQAACGHDQADGRGDRLAGVALQPSASASPDSSACSM